MVHIEWPLVHSWGGVYQRFPEAVSKVTLDLVSSQSTQQRVWGAQGRESAEPSADKRNMGAAAALPERHTLVKVSLQTLSTGHSRVLDSLHSYTSRGPAPKRKLAHWKMLANYCMNGSEWY